MDTMTDRGLRNNQRSEKGLGRVQASGFPRLGRKEVAQEVSPTASLIPPTGLLPEALGLGNLAQITQRQAGYFRRTPQEVSHSTLDRKSGSPVPARFDPHKPGHHGVEVLHPGRTPVPEVVLQQGGSLIFRPCGQTTSAVLEGIELLPALTIDGLGGLARHATGVGNSVEGIVPIQIGIDRDSGCQRLCMIA